MRWPLGRPFVYHGDCDQGFVRPLPKQFGGNRGVAHIAWLEQELSDLDKGLRQTLRRSPVWREKDDLLRTVPGVGEQLSLTLLANLPELGTLNRRQDRCPCGRGTLQPGQWHPAGQARRLGRTLSGAGRPLHGERWSPPRHNPAIRDFYQRLLATGKPKKVALVASMRKLLVILNSMLQTWLLLVRYDSASRRSFLLAFKTVAVWVLLFWDCLAVTKPLSQEAQEHPLAASGHQPDALHRRIRAYQSRLRLDRFSGTHLVIALR